MRIHAFMPVLMAAVVVCGCQAANGPSERADYGLRGHATANPQSATRNPKSQAPTGTVAASEGQTGPRGADATEPTGAITLSDAFALALVRNPGLKTFPYELRAAEARMLQAGLWPNPELQIEVEEFGGRGERAGFDAAETTVQIGQPIELAGKRAKRTRVAALEKELVQWDYESARLDVMREVRQAFTAVLTAQERLALAERLLDLSMQARSAVALRVGAGKDSPVDELRAGVAVSESRIEQQKAQKALLAARHALAAAWGSHAPLFEKAAGDLYEISQPPPLQEPEAAIAVNPDVARWETEQARRRAALRLEQARAMPDVTAGGGVRRFEATDDAAMVFALSVPIPLFDHNQGGIREAIAALAEARQRYETVRVKTLAALTEAVNALAAAWEEASTLRQDVLPKSQQAFDAVQQGYRQGKFDYLYVLDTQRSLFQTQAAYIDSVEAYHKARADVERLIGRSLDAASENVPAPSEAGQTGE